MHTSYITSAAQAHQLPPSELPEIAIVGRSNCGKSSLINALLQHRGLARVSRTPGRTQMVNFFRVLTGKRELVVVDLPGYGYSAVGADTRRPWQELMSGYFARPNVESVIFLLDSRRCLDLPAEDLRLMAYVAAGASLQVILTKADKLSQAEVQKAIKAVQQRLARAHIHASAILAVSSLRGTGIDKLRGLTLDA